MFQIDKINKEGGNVIRKYQLIFCILTYKNYTDLKEFIKNIKSENRNFSYKIIVGNSFADEKSSKKISEIASLYNCDFIEFENKGYGYGNNRAIERANMLYDYEYLVVCNPDTLLGHLDYNDLKMYQEEIIAPMIIAAKGNNQNPMNVTYMPIAEWILFKGFKKSSKLLFYCGITLIKVKKSIDTFWRNILKRKQYEIHICHGSFIIFTKNAIEKLLPIFDEKIFLFGEEGDLGRKAKSLNVKILYDKRFKVYHKEDGSMKLSGFNLNKILRESFIYYYEKWRKL